MASRRYLMAPKVYSGVSWALSYPRHWEFPLHGLMTLAEVVESKVSGAP